MTYNIYLGNPYSFATAGENCASRCRLSRAIRVPSRLGGERQFAPLEWLEDTAEGHPVAAPR